MKIGYCTNMSAKDAKGTGLEQVQHAAQAGFAFIELPLAQLASLTEEELQAALAMLQSSKIPCVACNNFFPASMRLTGADVQEEKVLTYVESALSLARQVGAGIVVFGSGSAKMVPKGFPMEQGYRQVVELLRQIAPVAKMHGIVVAIEPLNRGECNLINTFEEGCRLCDDVAEENVRVLVDYYHLALEREPLEAVCRRGRAYLAHAHFAEPEGRRFPILQKEGYRAFAEALRSIGFTGGVSLEACSDDVKCEVGAAWECMQALFCADSTGKHI